MFEQLITQTVDEDITGGKEEDVPTTAEVTPKASHSKEDTVSAAMHDTLTLDSTPSIADDNVKENLVNGDKVMAEVATVSTGGLQTNSDSVTKVDSAPDTSNDERMTEFANTGESQAASDGGTDEVCYYYDTKQYDKVLRDTFRAVHGDDTIDGNISDVGIITPNLDQIINGHQLRMYKRTAKVCSNVLYDCSIRVYGTINECIVMVLLFYYSCGTSYGYRGFSIWLYSTVQIFNPLHQPCVKYLVNI